MDLLGLARRQDQLKRIARSLASSTATIWLTGSRTSRRAKSAICWPVMKRSPWQNDPGNNGSGWH